MMNLARLPLLLFFALLALHAPARAEEAALFTLETYSLPAATWMKIPTTMRDDHRVLRNTLFAQLPKGSVRLVDRRGGHCRTNLKNQFDSHEEILVPSAFGATQTALFPLQWKSLQTGGSLELAAYFNRDANLGYSLTSSDPPSVPLLKAGKRLDVERVTHPLLSTFRLDSNVPIAPISLVALAPDPDPRHREQRVLVSFLLADGLPAPAGTNKREPGYTLELMGLRGTTRTTETPTPELIKNLVRRSDALAFALGSTQTPGDRCSVDSIREIPFPSKAEKGPTGPFPSMVETIPVGTILSVQLSPVQDGKVPVIVQIDHDWRTPQVPTIPGKDEDLIETTRTPYTMQLRVRQEIEPGNWVLLLQQPLSALFGPEDRETRGESCFLFGRLVIGK